MYATVHCLTLKDMEIVRYRVLTAENMVMIIVFCGCHAMYWVATYLLYQERRNPEDGSRSVCERVVPVYQTAHYIPKNRNLDSSSVILAILYRLASVGCHHASTFVIFKQHVVIVLLWFVSK